MKRYISITKGLPTFGIIPTASHIIDLRDRKFLSDREEGIWEDLEYDCEEDVDAIYLTDALDDADLSLVDKDSINMGIRDYFITDLILQGHSQVMVHLKDLTYFNPEKKCFVQI